ncbi:MAG: DUF2628 domain-containing protein [Planctomycetota bacterium]|nr:MAG: DUF2628 domain-containing protein [Planctomycetota bacterium]
MPGLAEFDQRDNPYRACAVEAEPFPVHTSLEEEVQLLGAFVGPRANYYLRRWLPKLEDPEAGDVSMNWAAFFLGGWWMAYRKMYRNVFLLASFQTSCTVAQQFALALMTGNAFLIACMGFLVSVMTMFVVGLCSNAWYLGHARRQIASMRRQGFHDEQLLMALSRQGGTNFWAGVGVVVLCGMAMGTVIMIASAAAISMGRGLQ